MIEQKKMEVPADMEVSITLKAIEWSGILRALDEMPRKIANPLVDLINDKILAQAKDFANSQVEMVVDDQKEDSDQDLKKEPA